MANVTLEQTPSQATELLEVEPQNSEKENTPALTKEEPTMSQIEEIRGKRYQAMPEMDVRVARDEKIPPGTMKEILVHTGIGHEGICLITPLVEGDIRCIYPRAISLMTEQPLQATKKDPIAFSRKGNKDMRQYATYAAYNTSHETIILPKNQLVGQCQLILQSNEGAYQ